MDLVRREPQSIWGLSRDLQKIINDVRPLSSRLEIEEVMGVGIGGSRFRSSVMPFRVLRFKFDTFQSNKARSEPAFLSPSALR
jgi:hypothetical protein